MNATLQIESRQKIWTVSNFLSFSRLILLVPIMWSLSLDTPAGNLMALVFMLLAGTTDWFDGFLARRYKQQSELGRVIDPLTDKISVGAIALYLSLFRDFPFWFLLLILGRDFTIIILGLLLTSRWRRVPESNWYGKVAVTAMAVVLIAFTLDLKAVKWPFFWIMVVLFFISAGVYAGKFFSEYRKVETTG